MFRAAPARVHRSVWKLAADTRVLSTRARPAPPRERVVDGCCYDSLPTQALARVSVSPEADGPTTAFHGRSDPMDPEPTSVRTSDQARGPAEFKHITKRRKRN